MEQVRKLGFFSRAKNFIKEFVASDEEEMEDAFNSDAFKDEDAETLKLLKTQATKMDEKAKTMFEDKQEKAKGLKKSLNAKVEKVNVKVQNKQLKDKEDREIED